MEYKILRKFSLFFLYFVFLFSFSQQAMAVKKAPFALADLVLNPVSWVDDVCEGASATFTVDTVGTGSLFGGSLEVLWEENPILSPTWTVIPNTATPLTQTVSPTENMRYRVTLTVKDISNVVVEQEQYLHSLSIVDLAMGVTKTYEICKDASVSLQGQTGIGTQWQWLDELGAVVLPWSSNLADQKLQNEYPSNSTVYYFVARKGICEDTQEHLVTVKPYVEFTTNPDAVVACKDDLVDIEATSTLPAAGVSYSWSNDGGVPVNGSTYTLPTAIAKVGSVIVTSSAVGYCAVDIEIPYSITQLQISPDNWPTSYCPGSPLPLSMNVTQTGGLLMSMEWSEDGVAQGIDATSAIFNPTNSSATYKFEVSTSVCSEEFEQTITETNINIDIDYPENVCPGDQAELTAITDATGNFSITWTKLSDSDLLPTAVGSSAQSISVNPTERTTYTAKITNQACENTSQAIVEMFPVPTIFDVTELGIKEIQMMVVGGTPTYMYSVDDPNNFIDNEGYFKDESFKFGKHIAYVMDENGCKSSFNFDINALPLEFPAFFTPNGDGVNDAWQIGNFEQYLYTGKVYIVDRFGKMLKKFWGCDLEGWDGTYLGKPMPSDDYWYVAHILETDKKYVGHFTLIR